MAEDVDIGSIMLNLKTDYDRNGEDLFVRIEPRIWRDMYSLRSKFSLLFLRYEFTVYPEDDEWDYIAYGRTFTLRGAMVRGRRKALKVYREVQRIKELTKVKEVSKKK